jgi:uncharacterized protein involved in response to NO
LLVTWSVNVEADDHTALWNLGFRPSYLLASVLAAPSVALYSSAALT